MDFLKPDKKKIIRSLCFFIVLLALAYAPLGRIDDSVFSDSKFPVAGGLNPYVLNPALWPLAPLTTNNHGYVEYYPVDNVLMAAIPYWMIVSYLLSCLSLKPEIKLSKKS